MLQCWGVDYHDLCTIFSCSDDQTVSINPTGGGAKPIYDEYEPAIGASVDDKKGTLAFSTDEDSGKVVPTSYQQIGETPAFENPLYGTNLAGEEFAKEDLAAEMSKVEGRVENPYATVQKQRVADDDDDAV